MKEEKIEAPQTASEMDSEIKRIELELAKQKLEDAALEREERRLNMQALRKKIGDQSIAELQQKENRAAMGRTFAQDEANDRFKWNTCTHRKGGTASARDIRCLSVGGNSVQYAVIKHQMINGDIWVRCLRCGRTWQPPVKALFYFNEAGKHVAPQDGTFDQAKFDKAVVDYKTAVEFPTNNSMSGSVQCRFFYLNERGEEVDAAGKYRENIKDSTLR